jgi:hypothetical protein
VELEEDQARLLGRAVMNVIEDNELDLSDEQMDRARELLGNALVELSPAIRPAGLPRNDVVDAVLVEIDEIR